MRALFSPQLRQLTLLVESCDGYGLRFGRRTLFVGTLRYELPEARVKGPAETFKKAEDNSCLSYMRQRPEYAPTLFFPEKLETKIKNKEVNLHPVASEIWQSSLEADRGPLHEARYKPMVKEIVAQVKSCSVDDLHAILLAMRRYPVCWARKDPQFFQLWSNLDSECLRRVKDAGPWTLEEMLVMTDAWYPLNLSRRLAFHWEVVKRCFRKCHLMNRVLFVRFMFCINQARGVHDSINTYELEFNLKRLINELTVEEIAAVALAFFKTETPIRDTELLFQVMEKCRVNSDKLDSYGATAIAKTVRLSARFDAEDKVIDLMKAIAPHIHKMSPVTCLHLLLMGTQSVTVMESSLYMPCVRKLEENLSSLRIKDIDRLTLCLLKFNVPFTDLWDKIVIEIQNPARSAELDEYGKVLPSVLYNLAQKGIYRPNLIEKVLSKEYYKRYFAKADFADARDLLCLDISVEIELPRYTGPRMSEKIRNNLLKRSVNWIPADPLNSGRATPQVRFARVMNTIIGKVFKKSPLITALLPQHLCLDVVLCTDNRGVPVNIPPYLTERTIWEVKKLPTCAKLQPIVFHAFVFLSRNQMDYASEQPTGLFQMRIRLLQKLGYTVHMVNSSHWVKLAFEDQLEYVAKQIRESCPDSQFSEQVAGSL